MVSPNVITKEKGERWKEREISFGDQNHAGPVRNAKPNGPRDQLKEEVGGRTQK